MTAMQLTISNLSKTYNGVTALNHVSLQMPLPRRSQTWKLLDTIAVDVAFSDQGERYNLLTINGKPTRKSFKEIGGIQSDSEFGSMLQWIFQPESQTKFQSERPTDVRGREVLVFSYRIEQEHSKFEVNPTNATSL